jgi:hypothetical protein
MRKLLFVLPVFVFLISISPLTAASQTKQVWVAPKAGIWTVSGSDEENTKWTATMRIAKRGIRNKLIRYSGYFSWKSEDGETAGREYFNGSFDRWSGSLRLTAYRAKSEKGELGVGNYRAFVSRKGRDISRGVWFGASTVPGKWAASWERYK